LLFLEVMQNACFLRNAVWSSSIHSKKKNRE